MATPLSPSNALLAIIERRAVKVNGSNATLTICDDGNGAAGIGFTATFDPVIRFAYRYNVAADDPDTTTFTVGVRPEGVSVWTTGVAVEITRDGTTEAADATATWTGDVDLVRGDGIVYVALRPTNLDAYNGAIELAVDLEGGKGIELLDLRIDLDANA